MSNKTDKFKVTYLKDYRPADFFIPETELIIELKEKDTIVSSKLHVVRNQLSGKHARSLVLHGEGQVLQSITLNGKPCMSTEYEVDTSSLTIANVPDEFVLEIKSLIQPQENTTLSGLYRSNQMFCTQCEAEGFRRITYFLDRPDVLSKFTTQIIADKVKYPILLSNGNRVAKGDLEGGRHWVKWIDPFNKPCYLFALVAGHLHCNADTYRTSSGKTVALEIYVEPENRDKTAHALNALKKAMRWDEETFGLEYDLDLYMIVAVNDFNMGAMENKGLNIFNSKYVLADQDIATDTDFENIESVIGHEYFHNWTGNRVTCRDWFQLSLKEGLTVFREQLFSADCGNGTVKRIQDVNLIRAKQFSEDAGPLAHPVRPDSYIEINNFYTMTIYHKGAEVIRMLHTLLGEVGFRKGMDLYFERHDGQAATTDNFVEAMSDANGVDLSQFKRWYVQAGTPTVTAQSDYDPKNKIYTLKLSQYTPPTPDNSDKKPFVIPIKFALLNAHGTSITDDQILVLKDQEQSFIFRDINENPVPSLLGGFSAPVKLNYTYSDTELIMLMGHDPDLLNRWDSCQKIYVKILSLLYKDLTASISDSLIDGLRQAIHTTEETGLLAQIFSLPSFDYLLELMGEIDPIRLLQARDKLKRHIASALAEEFERLYQTYHRDNQELTKEAMGARQLKNTALAYLMLTDPEQWIHIAKIQYEESHNMTDRMGSLYAINDVSMPLRATLLKDFYEKWAHVPLVVNKWFLLEAQSRLPETPRRVKELTAHKSFAISNPNNVYALIRGFASNPQGFHEPSGEGYDFLANMVLELNKLNPQVAARVVEPLTHWRKYSSPHSDKMKAALNQILVEKNLSNDVYELAQKSLSTP
ncbi:MAG: aminopeptidase N [Gammaproteobacteria bacterium]